MEKIDALNKVSEFHKCFEIPIIETPQIPNKERCQLRISLIQEELTELSDAIENKDIVEIADAFCDLQYVLTGAVLEFGLGEKFEELFNEVHRSNMTKLCESEKEAIDTINYYKQKDGTESSYKNINNKWLVYRIKDDKVLKSINYSPVNLNKIL
jgi:predicted HAD superfamily Cof-like phosphohydrolase